MAVQVNNFYNGIPMKTLKIIKCLFSLLLLISFLSQHSLSQQTSENLKPYAVIIDSDTLFHIYNSLGIFSADVRANEINKKLNDLLHNQIVNYDSISIIPEGDHLLLSLPGYPIMAVTSIDASNQGSTLPILAANYRGLIVKKLSQTRHLYSGKNLINNSIFSVIYLVALVVFLFLLTRLFPWLYKKVKALDQSRIKNFNIRDTQLVKSSTIVSFLLVILKGLRLIITLLALYIFLTEILHLWPYTRKWQLEPLIKTLVLLVFYSAMYIVLFKSINTFISFLNSKYQSWKGTKIKTLRIKSIDILSADRTVEVLVLVTKFLRFVLQIILFYIFITIIFSLFTFSRDWAEKLFNYFLNPVNTVLEAIGEFLPNLFFIIVLSAVFRYIIRFVRFLFSEINSGTIEFPGFHRDWAMPTYKIVRFLILVLAAIVIFPYLPGSNSPFFQGISVFLGILLSLGSSSAIANIVAGVVLTYMRPFKIGDRVRIADTVGDVVEKTLLVSRVRTIKNVDITIPNAMVLSSHIINFSSSAADKGLILHTGVTIGYDVPWRKVHELLISAANDCESVLKEPKPFVLQTSLDDFYVAYELNAYTSDPQGQGPAYSEIHSKIQDKFNEAGVEIMSPHYGAMRDGNQTTIPENYLPKDYKTPPFRLFGVNFGNKNLENS